MDVEIISSSEGLAALKDDWEALERADIHTPYYVTHRFVSAWWDAHETKTGIELQVLCARQNGQLVGVAPLSVRTERRKQGEVRVVRFASHGDYLGFLLHPDQNADNLLKRLMSALESDVGWDFVALTNLAAPSRLVGYLFRSEHNESLSLHVENPRIGLRDYAGFEDFVARHLPSKVRKYRNKLYRERDVSFRVVRGNEGDIFDRIAALHRLEKEHLVSEQSREERYSLFEIPERAAHVRNVFTRTDDAVTFVYETPDGELVGYRTCYLHGRTLLSWNSAYHPDFLDHRIGKVIQYDVLDHVFEHDLADVFDFGAGRYPWKFEWTDDFSVTFRLQVRRPAAGETPQVGPEADRTAEAARPSPQAGPGAAAGRRPAATPGQAPPASAVPPVQRARRAAARLGLGKARRALARGRTALQRRAGRTVVWYAPHPDDETIFMGGSIRQHRTGRNVVVMLTRGGGSGAIDLVNRKLDRPLTREQFMNARLRELRAAVRALGVTDEDLVLKDLPDGGLDEQAVLQVVEEMAARFPRAEHRTMSYLDPHRDHATAGRALQRAYDREIVKRAVFHVPVPLVEETLGEAVALDEEAKAGKRAALGEYARWRPAKGRYAIGSHSVRKLIRDQREDPRERTHGPGYRP